MLIAGSSLIGDNLSISMSKSTVTAATTTAAVAVAVAVAVRELKSGKTVFTASGKTKLVPHILPTHTKTHTQVQAAPSFRDILFESEIMKKIISYQNPTPVQDTSIDDLTYRSSDIFPDWITSNVEWKGVRKTCVGSVTDVLSRYLGSEIRDFILIFLPSFLL